MGRDDGCFPQELPPSHPTCHTASCQGTRWERVVLLPGRGARDAWTRHLLPPSWAGASACIWIWVLLRICQLDRVGRLPSTHHRGNPTVLSLQQQSKPGVCCAPTTSTPCTPVLGLLSLMCPSGCAPLLEMPDCPVCWALTGLLHQISAPHPTGNPQFVSPQGSAPVLGTVRVPFSDTTLISHGVPSTGRGDMRPGLSNPRATCGPHAAQGDFGCGPHKFVSFVETLRDCFATFIYLFIYLSIGSSGIVSIHVFYVWPEIIVLPVWPTEAVRLDTPATFPLRCTSGVWKCGESGLSVPCSLQPEAGSGAGG